MSLQQISIEIDVFRGRKAPEKGILVGYGALIDAFSLPVPVPDELALVSLKRRSYKKKRMEGVFNKGAF